MLHRSLQPAVSDVSDVSDVARLLHQDRLGRVPIRVQRPVISGSFHSVCDVHIPLFAAIPSRRHEDLHMFLLAIGLSLLIGLSLGMLGGGGSILTVPILVYALGVAPKTAIATSLLVVGVTSGFAVIPHFRGGRVQLRTGLIFGVAGMVGAYFAGMVAHYIPANALLIAFAAMMLVTAVAMMRGRKAPATQTSTSQEPLPVAKVLLEGLIVGGVTGLVGAGGGFLVVPALVLLGGLPMSTAVGTSLVVIAMKSLAGFAGYMGHVEINWELAAIVTASAVVGSFLGSRLVGVVSPDKLRRAFAWFVVVMGLFMLAKQLPSELWSAVPGNVVAIVLGILFAVVAVVAMILRYRHRPTAPSMSIDSKLAA